MKRNIATTTCHITSFVKDRLFVCSASVVLSAYCKSTAVLFKQFKVDLNFQSTHTS